MARRRRRRRCGCEHAVEAAETAVAFGGGGGGALRASRPSARPQRHAGAVSMVMPAMFELDYGADGRISGSTCRAGCPTRRS